MKECPICHTQYDDSMSFCTRDGHQLTSVNAPTNETPNKEKQQNNIPKNKKGCIKTIIITSVVIIVGMIALYNYLINAATYLRAEPNEIHASKAGGTCNVDIDYDGHVWTVNHQPEWVNIYEYDKSFELKVDPNNTGQLREGSITIQSGKLLAQIIVRQNAYATIMNASETSIEFKKNGGNKDVIIETDGCNWVAEYTNWMTVTKESDSELHINCPINSGEFRTGIITVKEDNVYVLINVTQGGDCNNCHGKGEISCSSCLGMGGMGYGMFYSSCMWCGGRGKITCGVCNGSGVRE